MTALSVKTSEKSEQKSRTPVSATEEGYWPSLTGLRKEIDSLFENFTRAWPSWRSSLDFAPLGRMESWFGSALPVTDLIEKDKVYELSAEMPGLKADNVDVSLSGNVLTIKGEKKEEKEEKEEKGKNAYLSERRYGSFQRSFQLPEGIDNEKIEAKFDNGVLTVIMLKTAEAVKEQKTIAVKAA